MNILRSMVVVVLGIGTSQAIAQGGMPPAKVMLETLKLETLSDVRPVTGEIRSRYTTELASQVEGLVVEMLVDEGDLVKKGQVIAKLDHERAHLELSRAQAQVESDRAVIEQFTSQLDQSKRDLARLEELDTRASAGAAQLDNARTLVHTRSANLAQAKADLLISESSLKLAEKELSDKTIRAPFDGSVVLKQTEVGQWISRGDAICTIVSMTELEARIDVPESLIAALDSNPDTNIEVILPGDLRVSAKVLAIVSRADSLSRLFPVRLVIDAQSTPIRPGMSLTAMVPTGTEAELLTVSKDAIMRGMTGEHVFFNGSGTAAIAPIVRQFSVGSRVVVRSPMLQPGMQVVIEGNERMFPSQPLMVLEIDGVAQQPQMPGGGGDESPADGQTTHGSEE